jgi:hypothetical protein
MLSNIKLQSIIKVIDEQIDDLKLELSYLEAAKKNIVTLVDKLPTNGNSSQPKQEETNK